MYIMRLIPLAFMCTGLGLSGMDNQVMNFTLEAHTLNDLNQPFVFNDTLISLQKLLSLARDQDKHPFNETIVCTYDGDERIQEGKVGDLHENDFVLANATKYMFFVYYQAKLAAKQILWSFKTYTTQDSSSLVRELLVPAVKRDTPQKFVEDPLFGFDGESSYSTSVSVPPLRRSASSPEKLSQAGKQPLRTSISLPEGGAADFLNAVSTRLETRASGNNWLARTASSSPEIERLIKEGQELPV